MFVLHVIKEHGALSVGDLAERTATDPSSVSVVVRKKPSAEDHRRLMVNLTAAGSRTVEKSPIPVQEILMERMSQMAPDQLHTLAELLEQVAPPREGQHPAPMFFHEGAGGGRRP
jgi:DNA-binding MarR family transcriptional regulator